MNEIKLPAHDIEAERAVLGAILIQPDILPDLLATGLSPEDFWSAPLRETYRATLDLLAGSVPLDIVTLKDELNKRKVLDPEKFGVVQLGELFEVCPVAANGPSYARIVRRKAVERHIGRLQDEIGKKIAKGEAVNGEWEQLVEAGKQLESAEGKARSWKDSMRVGPVPASDLVDLVDQPIPYLIWPVVVAGSLTIIQGAPKGGKSSFALFLALCATKNIWPTPDRLAADRPLRVLYLAWEDPKIMMAKRLALYLTGLGLSKKELPPELVFLFAPSVFVNQEQGTANLIAAIQETKADIVVIDTLSHIHGADDENDSVAMTVPMKNLARIAQETQAAILFAHHTGKGSKDKDTHEKARGSVAIAAAWHICIDWGRREEGSDLNPVKVISKYEHEELKWEIAYNKTRDDSTNEVTAVNWDIRAPEARATKGSLSKRDQLVDVVRAFAGQGRPWVTTLEVAEACDLGLDERSIRRHLASLCPDKLRSGVRHTDRALCFTAYKDDAPPLNPPMDK